MELSGEHGIHGTPVAMRVVAESVHEQDDWPCGLASFSDKDTSFLDAQARVLQPANALLFDRSRGIDTIPAVIDRRLGIDVRGQRQQEQLQKKRERTHR